MLNNRIIKSIAALLVAVFAISTVLPSQQVMALGQILGNQNFATNGVTGAQRENVDIAPETQMGLFSEALSNNFNRVEELFKGKDIKGLREIVKDTLTLVEESKEAIFDELESNEAVLEGINSEAARSRHIEFKKQLEENMALFEEILRELELVASSFDESNTAYEKLEKKIAELEMLIKPVQVNQTLGSSLPHKNVQIEPSILSKDTPVTSIKMMQTEEKKASVFSNVPAEEDLKETSEVQFTEEIVELAESFNTVIEVYEYVRNNINFEAYYGSRKGAEGTLAEVAGNDFDQASLLISLLRYKGIPARYVRGTVEIPVEKIMGWTGGETPQDAVKILASLGIPTVSVVSGGKISHVRTEHVWVEAYVPYQYYRGVGPMKGQKIWVPLDPSFKQYEKIEGLDFSSIIDIDAETSIDGFKDGIVVSDEMLSVSRVNTESVLEKIEDVDAKIEEYINQKGLEEIKREELLGGKRIIPQSLDILPLSLPYKVDTVIDKTSAVPEELKESIVFSIGSDYTGSNDFKYEAYAPEIYGKRITLSWIPASSEDEKIINQYGGIFKTPAYLVQMKPQLKIGGDVVAQGKAIGLGNTQEFKMTIKPVGLSQEDVINSVTVGGFYCVGLDYGIVSPKELQEIAQNIENLKDTISIDNIYTDEAMGEILNAVSKAYFIQLNMYDLFLESRYDVASTKLLSEAMTGYEVEVNHMFMSPVEVKEGSMYIDVDRNAKSVISVNGDKRAEKSYMMLSGQISSTMEHGIFEQMVGIPSVSTIKVLQEANERGIPLHTVTKDNVNDVLEILDVGQVVKEDIRNSVNAGRIVTIPEESIQYYGWNGTGYIVMDPETGSAGYMISGGIAGGAMSVGQVLTKFVTYVISGLFAMIMYHLIETAILLLVPGGWIVGAVKVLQAIRIVIVIYALISFVWNACTLIEMYNATGDVYYLQELLIQIAALSTLMALNLGPLKGLHQKIEGLKGEIVALKLTVLEMQAKGIPPKVVNDFLKTYGMGRVGKAKATMGYFKDYGLSDKALQTIGRGFNAETIETIQNTYMRSKVFYSGTDTDLILILFKQAGNSGAASTLSNSLITLGNSGIVPSAFGEYGIISSISGMSPAVTALSTGITPALMKKLFGFGIRPTDYDGYGIVGADSAETVAEALGNIKFTRAYVNTLKSISDDFASTLSKYDLTIEEFDAVRLTRYEFLNATAEEITNTFNTERELAGEEFADKPDLLTQKLRLIDDEYNIVMKQRQVLQNLTPEQRLTKYESLIALRNAYEAPDSDTLIIKCLSIDDAYNFLKENEAYGTIGGYVLKAGDTKAINTYDDLMATLRLDYINNPFEKTPSKNFVEISYKTKDADKITIPIEEGYPWPCTNKGFLANVNGEIVPEYYSPRLEPSVGEMYLVDGITGERTLIAVFGKIQGVKRFIPINGSYWTEDLVKILKGE